MAADALERDVDHGPEEIVHPGLHPRLVQMAASCAVAMGSAGPRDTSGSGDSRTRASLGSRSVHAGLMGCSPRDGHRDHGGDPRAASQAPLLGSQEAVDHPEEAASQGRLACEIDGLRFLLATRHGREEASKEVSGHPGKPAQSMDAPNDTWCVDYKGEFKTGDGVYCYPLTAAPATSFDVMVCRPLLTRALGPCFVGFSRSTASRRSSVHTPTASRSQQPRLGDQSPLICGFDSASTPVDPNGSLNRTGAMSGCTRLSSSRPRGPRPPRCEDSKDASITSAGSSTKSALTKPSARRRRLRDMRRHRASSQAAPDRVSRA